MPSDEQIAEARRRIRGGIEFYHRSNLLFSPFIQAEIVILDYIDELTAALRDITNSGVEMDDERIDYVVMQVDREALAEARRLLAQWPEGGEG